MKTKLKKSLALIFTALIVIGSCAIALNALSTESVGTINVSAKFLRFDSVANEWIETDRAVKGETLKARVYVETDYYTTSGRFLVFYDNAFFTDSNVRDTIINVNPNPYYKSACNMSTQLMFYSKDGKGVNSFIKNGNISEEFAQTHTCVGIMYLLNGLEENEKLNGNEWLTEFELTVKEDTTLTEGSVFTLSSAFQSPKNQNAFADIPYGEEGGMMEDTASLFAVYVDIEAPVNSVSTNSNVILDANGGYFAEDNAEELVFDAEIGSEFNLAYTPEPIKDGFAFDGWTLKDGTPAEAELGIGYDDVELVAQWVPGVNVTFWLDEAGTEVYYSEVVALGSELIYPDDPTIPGYTFDAWSEPEGMELTEDLEVYPTYTPNEYLVQVYGLYSEVIDEWIAFYGDTVTVDDLYDKEYMDEMLVENGDYYTFDFWTVDGAELTEITITDDVIIEGVFTGMDATLIFDANGATFANGEEIIEVELKYDDEITADMYPEIPEYAGHTFKAWSMDLVGQPMDELEKTITITWVKNTYTVTYHVGETVDSTVSATYGETVNSSAIPSASSIPEGYVFAGWSRDMNATEPEDLGTVDGNVNVYAVLKPSNDVAYSVEIYMQGTDGSYELTDVEEYTNGTTGEIAPYVVDNSIEGFTYSAASSLLDVPVAADGSTILCVYYQRNKYTLSTYSDGELIGSQSYYYGKVIDKADVSDKVGSSFGGWVYKGTDEAVTFPLTMPAENVEIEATWIPAQYTITFDTGCDETVAPVTYLYGELVDLPVIARTGYVFDGWSLNGEKISGKLNMPAENITLKAEWTPADGVAYKVNHYFMNVAGNGYDLTTENLTGTTGEFVTVTPKAVEGFTFNAANSRTEGTISANGSTKFDLYYTRNKYDFIAYAGNEIFEENEYFYGATVNGAGTPAKSGYTFEKWVYKNTGADVIFPIAMPAEQVEIEAAWIANEYTVTFNTNGGDALNELKVRCGVEFTLPSATKAGYAFAFWSLDDGSKYAAAQNFKMPAGNVTFTAVWLLQSNKVTYTVGSETFSFDVAPGQAIPLPDMSGKPNIEIIGWLDASGNEATITEVMPENDLAFTAKIRYNFSDNPYGITVSYEGNVFNHEGDELTLDVKNKNLDKESGGIYFNYENYKQLALYDIKVKHGNSDAQPSSGKKVTVSIPVPASYKDGTTFLVINRLSNGAIQYITVTKAGDNLVFDVNALGEFEICVKSETKIFTLPKTDYIYREALDLSGLSLEVLDENGNKTVIDDTSRFTVNGYNPRKAGIQTLTVEYDGTSVQFDVTVKYAWWQWIIRILLLGFLWY